MAEFCSKCSLFDVYDFDLFKIALGLENGHSENILCEGCNIRGVYKDEEGRIFLAKMNQGEIKLEKVSIEFLINPKE